MTSFGESHGKAMGVVVDGVPAGLAVSLDDLRAALKKRAPGHLAGTTTRIEEDDPIILSGIYEGKTLGSPIAIMVNNTNQRSSDYNKIKSDPRPGHADATTLAKFGLRDHRGGGRSSGRETLSRVIGGYFASLIIPKVRVKGFISKLGPYTSTKLEDLGIDDDFGKYSLPGVPEEDIKEYLLGLQRNGESVGGRVRIIVDGCPAGLGEPAFSKLKSDLGSAILSIGAVVSFSFGLGEEMANLEGSVISKKKESFGGIEGGISNGDRIVLNLTFKPTSTVGEKAKEGRHDPCIIPRAIPVVESMVTFVLADHYLRQNAYQLVSE